MDRKDQRKMHAHDLLSELSIVFDKAHDEHAVIDRVWLVERIQQICNVLVPGFIVVEQERSEEDLFTAAFKRRVMDKSSARINVDSGQTTIKFTGAWVKEFASLGGHMEDDGTMTWCLVEGSNIVIDEDIGNEDDGMVRLCRVEGNINYKEARDGKD